MTLPPGFSLTRGWADNRVVFSRLDRAIAWEQPRIRMYGRDVAIPRQTAWQGEASYVYSGIVNQPQGWHPMVLAMRDELARSVGVEFNSCLLNRYQDGQASVAWHADDEGELGEEPTIASVSLGGIRRFAIRETRGPGRWSVDLHDGDLLVMTGRSQADYEHAIPKTKRPCMPRINLTFRVVHP